jgi:hypothetical protein
MKIMYFWPGNQLGFLDEPETAHPFEGNHSREAEVTYELQRSPIHWRVLPVHADRPISLDQMDELIRQFRPIEQLFRVMAALGDAECDAETVRGCSDIGLSLTAKFREYLNRVPWDKEEPDVGQGECQR